MQKHQKGDTLDEVLLHEAEISLMKTRRILRFSSDKAKKLYVNKLRELLTQRDCIFTERKALSENEVETRKTFDANYNKNRYVIFK